MTTVEIPRFVPDGFSPKSGRSRRGMRYAKRKQKEAELLRLTEIRPLARRDIAELLDITCEYANVLIKGLRDRGWIVIRGVDKRSGVRGVKPFLYGPAPKKAAAEDDE